MKINHVHITNHEEPGAQWWEGVASKPDEPLIEATIRFTLSHREYHRLIDMDERKPDSDPIVNSAEDRNVACATSTFTYTLEDLRHLRSCLICNTGLAAALRAFMPGRGLYIIPWLEMAEKIKADRDYPEKLFATPPTGEFTESKL